MVKEKVFITDLRERTVSGIGRVQSTDRQCRLNMASRLDLAVREAGTE